MILVGIDPGIKTGYALYNTADKRFIRVETLKLWQVFDCLRACKIDRVYIENPNTWVPFKGKANESNARLQGAGAVKQTYKHIIELLEYQEIEYYQVRLQGQLKKKSASYFKQQTGWQGATSEHGRDAAMLVWQR